MRFIQFGVVAVGLLALGAGPSHAAEEKAESRGYAEGIYAEYAAGTGHQISFEVETLATGSVKQIADIPLGELVAASRYLVEADQTGTEINTPRFAAPYTQGYDVFMAMEMKNTPRAFETAAGYPVKGGTYRKLAVSATIGSETRQHEALEFCWAAQGHCTVLDPSVMFMESMAHNRMRLTAEGWGAKVVEEYGHDTSSGEVGTTAVCGLASKPSATWRSLTWGSRTLEYKNLLGGVLVRKYLGGQQSGIRCTSSCYPAPYGYSNVSSCQGFLGWSCDCDNDFGYGTTGRTGKWIAQTKCTHKFAFSANASATVLNRGSASVSISWSLDGSPDGTGGQLIDTCGYF